MLATTYPSKGLSSWKYALFTLTDALIRNRSCIAVRRGFIFTIPFVLLETLMQFMLYLVSVFPGIPFDYEISEILMVSIKTLNMTFSPILAFCIGYNIGSEWKLKTSQCFMVGFVSLVAFKSKFPVAHT